MNIFLKSVKALGGLAFAGILLVAAPVLAQTAPAAGAPTNGAPGWSGGRGHMMMRMPGVFGTVSAISGSTLTVTSKMPPAPQGSSASSNTTSTTYTVDASNATVEKGGTSSSVSSIAVGDTVMVQGTLSGTSVTAKTIRDGVPPTGSGPRGGKPGGAMPQIQGNGEPVIGGTVSAVSGNTLTVGTKAGLSYSVDVSSAMVIKGNATSSVSAIASGDQVVVQGTVSGTSVVAASVMDHGALPSSSSTSAGSSGSGATPTHGMPGFFGAIGGFFQHLFGFF